MDRATDRMAERIANEARGSKTYEQLQALAEKTLSLHPADKLRLAAALLEQSLPELALTIAKRAAQEIELAQLLGHR